MVSCEASSRDRVEKRPIATATVGIACQLELILPTWMDPDDISADVRLSGVMEVEKLTQNLLLWTYICRRSRDTVCDLDTDLDIDLHL